MRKLFLLFILSLTFISLTSCEENREANLSPVDSYNYIDLKGVTHIIDYNWDFYELYSLIHESINYDVYRLTSTSKLTLPNGSEITHTKDHYQNTVGYDNGYAIYTQDKIKYNTNLSTLERIVCNSNIDDNFLYAYVITHDFYSYARYIDDTTDKELSNETEMTSNCNDILEDYSFVSQAHYDMIDFKKYSSDNLINHIKNTYRIYDGYIVFEQEDPFGNIYKSSVYDTSLINRSLQEGHLVKRYEIYDFLNHRIIYRSSIGKAFIPNDNDYYAAEFSFEEEMFEFVQYEYDIKAEFAKNYIKILVG